MNAPQSLDISLFRFFNSSLANPVLDTLMPFITANPFYVPALLAILALLAWKGGARGRLCAVCVILALALGDGVVCKQIKLAVSRPRPFLQLDGVRLLVGKGGSGSMPSSHAANSFALVTAFWLFYRRSWRWTLPLAIAICISRPYVGVHFPSDVLAGAILGAGYTLGGAGALNKLWNLAGPKWFPLWWQRLPSLIVPDTTPAVGAANGQPSGQAGPGGATLAALTEKHWVRLGYAVIAALLATQILYLRAGIIDLTEDEAYQWLWSKHLALSYYSKPPMIALAQWVGTHLWGDTAFGVRFLSPVIAAVLGVLTLRFFASQNRAQAGFILVLALATTPLLAAGSILMTIDPLLVLFWTAGMIAGWRAIQPAGRLRDWVCVGLGLGLGFLSKYTALFQLASWAAIFVALPIARSHLRRPGPWVALGITALCSVPVLVWNSQHGWITVHHVASDGRLGESWQPTSRYLVDFIFSETLLLNPFFVVLLILAMIGWAKPGRSPLERYLVWMGVPVFFFYWAFSLHSRVEPNWPVPCALPFFYLGALRWPALRATFPRASVALLSIGLVFGLVGAVILHDTKLLQKAVQRTLPARVDPLKRARGWKEFGEALSAKRKEALDQGKEVFFIGDHYGMAGLMSFYIPEAKAAVTTRPLAYFLELDRPENQFYFWPGYLEEHPGENAIFVQSLDSPRMVNRWFLKWLRHGDSPALHEPASPTAPAPPPELVRQFQSVKDMGPFLVRRDGTTLHYFHLYFCEGALRKIP
jgi:4-amino-4-deoxy-L-arabinose transferase-like glycosyltransferase/membrane-associated phospholipid phosphatase